MSKKPLPKPYLTVRQPKRSRLPQNFPKMKYRARKRQHPNHVHWAPLGSAYIEITPEAQPFLERIQKFLLKEMRDLVANAEERFGNERPAPLLGTYALPEQFPTRPADEYSIAPLPRHLPTAVLNPNVRKRR